MLFDVFKILTLTLGPEIGTPYHECDAHTNLEIIVQNLTKSVSFQHERKYCTPHLCNSKEDRKLLRSLMPQSLLATTKQQMETAIHYDAFNKAEEDTVFSSYPLIQLYHDDRQALQNAARDGSLHQYEGAWKESSTSKMVTFG